MPAASRESFLRVAQAARQDRHHDPGQEAHRSPPRPQHGGELQAPGDDRSNAAAEIAVSYQLSAKRTMWGQPPSAVRPTEAAGHFYHEKEPHPEFHPPHPLIRAPVVP